MTRPRTRETQDEVGNALIVAQNALAGYAQLSNDPETEEHHQAALHALGVVQQAIRSAGVLEQQGIAPDDTVRFTDAFKELVEPEGTQFRYGLHTDGPNREGEVVRVADGQAEVDWNDVSLPRQMKTEHIEKTEPSWGKRTRGIQVGDRVRMSGDWLRSTGQVAGEMGQLRGTVAEIRDAGQPYARAIIDWDGEEEQGRVVLSNLEKVRNRGARR